MVSDSFKGWQTPPDKIFHLLTPAFCQKQKREETKMPYYPIQLERGSSINYLNQLETQMLVPQLTKQLSALHELPCYSKTA